MSQSLLNGLQLVQNAAARLLTCTRKKKHVTPILASLHWLPIQYRIDFKLLILVYKALHNLRPSYLADLCVHKPPRTLRSGQMTSDVPIKIEWYLRICGGCSEAFEYLTATPKTSIFSRLF